MHLGCKATHRAKFEKHGQSKDIVCNSIKIDRDVIPKYTRCWDISAMSVCQNKDCSAL